MELDVDAVEANEEVDEGLLALLARNAGEKGRLDLFARGELSADGDEKGERLGVDVSNFDSSLVGEEDVVPLADRVDTDVELGPVRVGEEGLDDEVVQGSLGLLDL